MTNISTKDSDMLQNYLATYISDELTSALQYSNKAGDILSGWVNSHLKLLHPDNKTIAKNKTTFFI